MCGYLTLVFLSGKNPKPCFPITQLSRIFTLLPINVFLMIEFEPIVQLSPIETFRSIMVLCPIIQLEPIETFFSIIVL